MNDGIPSHPSDDIGGGISAPHGCASGPGQRPQAVPGAWEAGAWTSQRPLRVPSLLLALCGLSLLALWGVAAAGWWILGRLFHPLLERSRAELLGDRILEVAALREEAHRHARRERLRQRLAIRLHDLDGRPLLLLQEEVAAFRRRCLSELELSDTASWGEVRRHWRRSSLRWHPDRGGDRRQWLRKQRAYESLRLLQDRSRFGIAAPIGGRGLAILRPAHRPAWPPWRRH